MCGFATDERKRVEKVGQVRSYDLDVVGIQESWEKDGTDVGSNVEEYAWIGRKREGQKPKSRGAGGVGFLVKDVDHVISPMVNKVRYWIFYRDARYCPGIGAG